MSHEQPVKATFTPLSGPRSGTPIQVHFNPISLQLSIANSSAPERQSDDTDRRAAQQYRSGSSATLSMELTFDTTNVGTDVRDMTKQIALLMKPLDHGENAAPAIVKFEWGTFVFQGMIQSYQETIDFFSPSGVPLRAKVNLSLIQQERVFEENEASSGARTGAGASGRDAAVLSFSASAGVTGISAMAGVGDVGRALGAANGLETLRFTSGPIALGASVSLSGPVAFASGGGGLGIGGGIGISGGVGVEGGVGVGGAIGGSSSAGVSATQGAFAGLRMSSSGNLMPPILNPRPLFPRADSVGLATDEGAQFGVGGRAKIEGSASLSADVGVNASLSSRIRFDER